MAKLKVPTIQEMLDAGVHFGHQVRRWHPKMEPYIYTVSKDIHIIDLEQTEQLLKQACEFMHESAKEGKKVVFIGTKKQSRDIIELEAKRCGAMYIKERWVGGTLTNFLNIRKNLEKLIKLVKDREEGNFERYTKKERLMIDREIEKMQGVYGGILNLRDVPQVLFIIDPKREKTAVREAKNAGVKTVAILDTNADPTAVDYAIPGNDDAIKSIALLVKAIADAVEQGYKEYGASKEEKKAEAEAEAEAVAKTAKAAAPEAGAVVEATNINITATESPVVTELAEDIEHKLVEEAVEKEAKPSKPVVKEAKDEKEEIEEK